MSERRKAGAPAPEKPRRTLRLWMLLTLVSTLVVTLTAGGIVIACRSFLQFGYEKSIRTQLEEGLSELQADGFSKQTADRLRGEGIQIYFLRESDNTLLYSSFFVPAADHGPTPPFEKNAKYYRDLIDQRLGSGDGSFFVGGSEPEEDGESVNSHKLYLIGRTDGMLFCLNLPLESTNTMIGITIRYVAVICGVGLVVSLLAFYLVSLAIGWPHKQVVETSARIAELDFSRRCNPSPVRELDDLASSVNAMSDRLQKSISDLQTENGLLRDELAKRQRQQKLTTDLIANLSHDLKTPIAVISSYAEGLQDGVAKTPEQREKYYDIIQRESEHMQGIVSKMLALSRLEVGAAQLRPDEFDLSDLLDGVLEGFGREMERRNLTLERDYPASQYVYSDLEAIRQCVVNYVQNAVYHINGGSLIRIRTEDLGSRVRLCVENSSAPVPAEEIPLLWEKLYRGDLARQRGHGEAGLGLCIVKENMERLGGEYGFENLPEEGMVRFWLCVDKAKE